MIGFELRNNMHLEGTKLSHNLSDIVDEVIVRVNLMLDKFAVFEVQVYELPQMVGFEGLGLHIYVLVRLVHASERKGQIINYSNLFK